MYVTWTLATLAVAGYGLATAAWQLMIACLAFNALETAGTIVWATLKQRHVPASMLGRVSSLDWMISIGLLPLSFALTAPAATAFGAQATLVGAAALGGAITLGALFLPGMRDLERGPEGSGLPADETLPVVRAISDPLVDEGSNDRLVGLELSLDGGPNQLWTSGLGRPRRDGGRAAKVRELSVGVVHSWEVQAVADADLASQALAGNKQALAALLAPFHPPCWWLYAALRGEDERLHEPAGRGEEGGELVGGETKALEAQNDRLAAHVEDDEAEGLSALEVVAVGRARRSAEVRAERQEGVAELAPDLAVELLARGAGDLDPRRRAELDSAEVRLRQA